MFIYFDTLARSVVPEQNLVLELAVCNEGLLMGESLVCVINDAHLISIRYSDIISYNSIVIERFFVGLIMGIKIFCESQFHNGR